jgi:hypothetical protein
MTIPLLLSGCYYCKPGPGDSTAISEYWDGCVKVMKEGPDSPLFPNAR